MAKVIQVIYSQEVVGKGTDDDLRRYVDRYFDFDGNMLFERDDIAKSRSVNAVRAIADENLTLKKKVAELETYNKNAATRIARAEERVKEAEECSKRIWRQNCSLRGALTKAKRREGGE